MYATLNDSQESGNLLMNSRNKGAPRSNPWGMPDVIEASLEVVQETVTLCLGLVN